MRVFLVDGWLVDVHEVEVVLLGIVVLTKVTHVFDVVGNAHPSILWVVMPVHGCQAIKRNN